jgi:SAM-dependent methyltransferase
MERLVAMLRAAAEPTRLRLLALASTGAFCVMDFTEILGQSQPRLSRHLKLLCESGLLERLREGANVWFALPAGEEAGLIRGLLARLPAEDPVLEADRRQAARLLSERARVASESFRAQGADWDEMRALGLPAATVEENLLELVPAKVDRLLDIGTGTGRLLELLAPRVRQALGVDASKAMLALARSRLGRAELAHCSVRLADMYRLPLADGSFDLAVLQMVLHHAADPAGVLAEAARVLVPGGTLLVVDLAPHGDEALRQRFAHRWAGFSRDHMHRLLSGAALEPGANRTVQGPLAVSIWAATRSAVVAAAERRSELAV